MKCFIGTPIHDSFKNNDKINFVLGVELGSENFDKYEVPNHFVALTASKIPNCEKFTEIAYKDSLGSTIIPRKYAEVLFDAGFTRYFSSNNIQQGRIDGMNCGLFADSTIVKFNNHVQYETLINSSEFVIPLLSPPRGQEITFFENFRQIGRNLRMHSELKAWYDIVPTEVFDNVQDMLIIPANLINVSMTALPITLCLTNFNFVDSNSSTETFPMSVIQPERKKVNHL